MEKLKVGLQLYGVRDHMEKNVEETLKAVKEAGYDYVEFAGYFGIEAPEMKAILDKYGLTAISAHQTYESILENPEYYINYYKTLGIKYSAIPWMPADKQKGSPDYKETIAKIEKTGRILADAGIDLLYHNHDFEFEYYEGKTKFDWLYDSVPAEFLKAETDVCWIHYAGFDPCEIINKYSGRVPIVHLKEYTGHKSEVPVYALIDDSGNNMEKKASEGDFRFARLGVGTVDIPAVLKASAAAGAQYVVVEQDESYEVDSLENARLSRQYLKEVAGF